MQPLADLGTRPRSDCRSVIADAAQRARAATELAATGVRVVAAPAWGDAAKPLGWNVRDANCHELTAEQHAACPGHVAWVEQD